MIVRPSLLMAQISGNAAAWAAAPNHGEDHCSWQDRQVLCTASRHLALALGFAFTQERRMNV
jgi:hypothetical protein